MIGILVAFGVASVVAIAAAAHRRRSFDKRNPTDDGGTGSWLAWSSDGLDAGCDGGGADGGCGGD